MGSGKSTWAINYINNNQEKKFLCVVPLLEECERFKEQTEIDIVILKIGDQSGIILNGWSKMKRILLQHMHLFRRWTWLC